MKIFSYPKHHDSDLVQTVAIIVAETSRQAKYLFEAELVKRGEVHSIDEKDLLEIDPSRPAVILVQEGAVR